MKIRIYAYYYDLVNGSWRKKRIQRTLIADNINAAENDLQALYNNKLKIIASAIIEE